MRTTLARAVVLVLLSLGAGCAIRPQSAVTPRSHPAGRGDCWAALMQLPVGARIEIDLRQSTRLVGPLASADPDGLVLSDGKVMRRVGRSDVSQIVHVGGRPIARSLGRGAGIGAGTGAVVSGVATRGHPYWIMVGAIGYGFFGSVIGALDGLTSRAREVICRW